MEYDPLRTLGVAAQQNWKRIFMALNPSSFIPEREPQGTSFVQKSG
jgi:hypothetical protein